MASRASSRETACAAAAGVDAPPPPPPLAALRGEYEGLVLIPASLEYPEEVVPSLRVYVLLLLLLLLLPPPCPLNPP